MVGPGPVTGTIYKEMKDSTRILAFLAWILIWTLIGFGLGRRSARNGAEPTIVRDTVSYTVYDTIVREKPVFVASYIHDTVRTYFTTVLHDSILVDVPIERRIYAEDSLYRAVVSGWRPSLDSLWVYPKTTTITITNTVKAPAPRWNIGITAGPSALVTPSGKVYGGLGASVGLSYRF